MPEKSKTPKFFDPSIGLNVLNDINTKLSNNVLVDREVFERTCTIESDSDKTKLILPSRGVFYDNIKTIKVRGLTIQDGIQLKKYEQSKNISHLIDVIQQCIQSDMDIREVTLGDFIFIIVYIVINSCTDAIYNINWTSFYENKNTLQFLLSNLRANEVDIEALKREVPNFKELKFTPARVKHFEALETNKYDEKDPTNSWSKEDTEFYAYLIQFLDEPTLEEQFIRGKALSLNSKEYNLLKKFVKVSDHSINPEIEVADIFFNPLEAIKTLTKREKLLENVKNENFKHYRELSSEDTFNLDIIKQEIRRVQELLKSQAEIDMTSTESKKDRITILPRPEKISIPLDIPSLVEPLYL